MFVVKGDTGTDLGNRQFCCSMPIWVEMSPLMQPQSLVCFDEGGAFPLEGKKKVARVGCSTQASGVIGGRQRWGRSDEGKELYFEEKQASVSNGRDSTGMFDRVGEDQGGLRFRPIGRQPIEKPKLLETHFEKAHFYRLAHYFGPSAYGVWRFPVGLDHERCRNYPSRSKLGFEVWVFVIKGDGDKGVGGLGSSWGRDGVSHLWISSIMQPWVGPDENGPMVPLFGGDCNKERVEDKVSHWILRKIKSLGGYLGVTCEGYEDHVMELFHKY
ncbi:hypothetical protein U1Q18_005035 [Sarracenia purpurea var. burkii]